MNNEELTNSVKSINAIINNIISLLEPYKKDLDTFKNIANSKVEEIARSLNSNKTEKGEETSITKLLAQIAEFDMKSIKVPRTNDN